MTTMYEEIFKSRANFESYMLELPMPAEICEAMQGYQKKDVERIAELTQNFQTFLNKVGDGSFNPKQYLVWIVTNPKEEIVNTMRVINQSSTNGLEIFIFKATLNGDKIDFECVLKPNIVVKQKREVNINTPSKQLQKAYWETYMPVCLESDYTEMQIKKALPQHFQCISIGKAGVQILQTINTQNNYVASEIAINNDKEIFEKLFEHKEEIEKEVGKLEWDSKENVKSAKIRKTFKIDINNPENHKKAILEHVKMGAELKAIVHKYL